ncbi:hypothetical protein BIV60_08205 [Bacillus sp. MUM 116]|nr:hypothetical protein BIV60_08205 [Bacillus sp. MUM 116]
MGHESIDNSTEIRRLLEELSALQQKIFHLNEKIQSIQLQCKHVFLETPVMRKCQKCGFAESTYY